MKSEDYNGQDDKKATPYTQKGDQFVGYFLEKLEEMHYDDSFRLVRDVLGGIYQAIEQSGRVTEKHLRSVNHIRESRGWKAIERPKG